MKHWFSLDLSEQVILAQGLELLSVMGMEIYDTSGKRIYTVPDMEQKVTSLANPVLITDNSRIAKLEYTIRETIHLLLQQPRITIEYDGLSMDFNKDLYPTVWSPSIDTLLFCRAIRGLNLDTAKSAIEIGCGPGFIGRYLAKKATNLTRIDFNDINPHAQRYYNTNPLTDKKDSTFILGDGKIYLSAPQNKYDIVACNPPYIPRINSTEDNAYEGMVLLKFLIEERGGYLNDNGILLINISTLAEKDIKAILLTLGDKVQILDKMSVPLKVGNILNNPDWLNYLIEERGLEKNEKTDHPYWQGLKILKIQK